MKKYQKSGETVDTMNTLMSALENQTGIYQADQVMAVSMVEEWADGETWKRTIVLYVYHETFFDFVS